MGHNFKLNSLSVAIVSSLFTMPLWAQNDNKSVDNLTEEVVVTGFRRSLVDALSSKRNSSNITDGISAEDIGKSADQNIAEALQRITGLSIDRREGEGSTVVVRGTSANLNNVTLNGVTLTSTSGDLADGTSSQAVDFSAFSSDILSQIEVVKTPSADQDEGSLGAAINLTTIKPLSLNSNRRVIAIQQRHNDFEGGDFNGNDLFGNGGDGRFNVSLSQKLFDDTVGISFVGTHESTSGRTDTYRISRYQAVSPGGPQFIGPATDRIEVQPGGLTNDQTGVIDQGVRVHAPFEVEYEQVFFNTERDSVTSTIQFQPTDQTDIQFDITYTKTQRERDIAQFASRPNGTFREGDNNFYDPDTLTLSRFRRTANGYLDDVTGNPIAGTPGALRVPGFVRPEQNVEDTTEENLIFGLDIKHTVADFTFNLRGGRSKSESRDDDFTQIQGQIENQPRQGGVFIRQSFNGLAGRPGFSHGFDCPNGVGSVCPIFVIDNVPNRTRDGEVITAASLGSIVDDSSEFGFGNVVTRDRRIDDESTNVFFDVDWDHELGPITSLETGLKWSVRERDQGQTQLSTTRFGFPTLLRQTLDPFTVRGQALRDGFGTELGLPRDAITDGIPLFDANLVLAAAALDPDGEVRVRPGIPDFRVIENTVFGGYIKANFEFFDSSLQGDIGVRYASTDVDVEGGVGFNSRQNEYVTDIRNINALGSEADVEREFGRDFGSGAESLFQGARVFDDYSYSNVLPSLNLNYNLSDSTILRFAASRTMARPDIDFTRPNFVYNENSFNPFSGANAGNPLLDPYLSDNLDFSYEWYFAEESLLSVALFNKDISDFVRNFPSAAYIRDARNIFYDADLVPLDDATESGRYGEGIGQPGFNPLPENLLLPFTPDDQPLADCYRNREFLDAPVSENPIGCDQVQYNRPINGKGGYVRGLELALQHSLTYLPGHLSGLGFTANYTYSDSETEEELDENGDVLFRAAPLPQTSLHTFNATVFYEKDGKQLRLAYNERSDFLVTTAPVIGGYQHYSEGSESLDLSGAWDVSDNLTINFQAVNLLDYVSRQYAVNDRDDADVPNPLPEEALTLGDTPTGRTRQLQNTGRIFRVGLRYQF